MPHSDQSASDIGRAVWMPANNVFLAVLALSLGDNFDTCAQGAQPPNVVFILADDSGFADFACYGHPYARTPNIDRLAAEGTRFRQFYSTGVTCCPARTGLMTSKFPATYATYPAVGGFGQRATVTELLKKRGYATGHFGKWHIGLDEKSGVYGIDVVKGDEAGAKKQAVGRGRDARIFDDAIGFIEERKGGPFYVNVWAHTSHHPVNPHQSVVDKFQDVIADESKFSATMQDKFAICKSLGGDVNEHLRRYLADISTLDDEVGRLLQRLDEFGLRDNTIVVFSSDQGPAPMRTAEELAKLKKRDKPDRAAQSSSDTTEIRLNAMGNVGEFRGGKHGMYEGGVRVPFIVRWPGRVPANRVDDESVISGVDWLPTLCALAGVNIDVGDFDGEDVSRAWLAQAAFKRTKPLFWKTSAPGSDVGIREENWKLIRSTRARGEVELYNLANDAAEKNNVAAQFPQVVQRLSTKAADWVATLPKEYVKTVDEDK